MSGENVERLEQLLLEGFGKGDMSVLDEVVAEEFIEHQQGLCPREERASKALSERCASRYLIQARAAD